MPRPIGVTPPSDAAGALLPSIAKAENHHLLLRRRKYGDAPTATSFCAEISQRSTVCDDKAADKCRQAVCFFAETAHLHHKFTAYAAKSSAV